MTIYTRRNNVASGQNSNRSSIVAGLNADHGINVPPSSAGLTLNRTLGQSIGGASSRDSDINRQGEENLSITSSDETSRKQKRRRGNVMMQKTWGLPVDKKIQVRTNKFGQPVGRKKKSNFVHFIGTVARSGQYIPVNYKSWKKVPEILKKNAVDLIQQKFSVSPGTDEWIRKSLGKYWRNWKSYLKNTYYDPSKSYEDQKDPPPRVVGEQWIGLLKYWETQESKDLCAGNKAHRSHQPMIHRTGKIGFAQATEELVQELNHSPTRKERFTAFYSKTKVINGIATVSVSEAAQEAIDKMNEIAKDIPPDFDDSPSATDIYAQVMGPEKHGRARLYGHGVCPSDIWGSIPSRSASNRVAMQLKSQLEEVTGQYQDLRSQFQELRSFVMEGRGNGPGNAGGLINGRASGTTSPLNIDMPPSQSIVARPNIRAGSRVILKSMMDPQEFVAKGFVSSTDPCAVVGRHKLGPNWCEVSVQVPLKRNEPLMRAYDPFETVGDALGATIAWPLPLVTLDDD